MFKLDGKTLQTGVAFTHNDIQYPANWLNLSTPEEKQAIGIVEIAEQPRPDDRYYWVTDNGDGTYTATAKDLVTLKANAVSTINNSVWSILQPTDYMDSRKANDPTYVAPAAWITWRASVSAAAKTAVTAINAAATVEDLIPLVTPAWPQDPNYVAPDQQGAQP